MDPTIPPHISATITMSTNYHHHPHHCNRVDSNLLPIKDLSIFLCASVVVALGHSSPKVAAKKGCNYDDDNYNYVS